LPETKELVSAPPTEELGETEQKEEETKQMPTCMSKVEDMIYQADQEAEDYGISTDDDSTEVNLAK